MSQNFRHDPGSSAPHESLVRSPLHTEIQWGGVKRYIMSRHPKGPCQGVPSRVPGVLPTTSRGTFSNTINICMPAMFWIIFWDFLISPNYQTDLRARAPLEL